MSSPYQLTHLKQLEAESIHIIREVAAEFNNPVMLYSIGKDREGFLSGQATVPFDARGYHLEVPGHVQVP